MISISAPFISTSAFGTMVCVTVTGAGPFPNAALSMDGKDYPPSSIRPLGHGVFTICFKLPPHAEGLASIEVWTQTTLGEIDVVI